MIGTSHVAMNRVWNDRPPGRMVSFGDTFTRKIPAVYYVLASEFRRRIKVLWFMSCCHVQPLAFHVHMQRFMVISGFLLWCALIHRTDGWLWRQRRLS